MARNQVRPMQISTVGARNGAVQNSAAAGVRQRAPPQVAMAPQQGRPQQVYAAQPGPAGTVQMQMLQQFSPNAGVVIGRPFANPLQKTPALPQQQFPARPQQPQQAGARPQQPLQTVQVRVDKLPEIKRQAWNGPKPSEKITRRPIWKRILCCCGRALDSTHPLKQVGMTEEQLENLKIYSSFSTEVRTRGNSRRWSQPLCHVGVGSTRVEIRRPGL